MLSFITIMPYKGLETNEGHPSTILLLNYHPPSIHYFNSYKTDYHVFFFQSSSCTLQGTTRPPSERMYQSDRKQSQTDERQGTFGQKSTRAKFCFTSLGVMVHKECARVNSIHVLYSCAENV